MPNASKFAFSEFHWHTEKSKSAARKQTPVSRIGANAQLHWTYRKRTTTNCTDTRSCLCKLFL